MIDIAALAAVVVGRFLVPRLVDGGERMLEQITDRAGEAAADGVAGVSTRLWDRVKGIFGGDPAGAAVLEEFERAPQEMQPAVEAMLAKRLRDDDEAAKELSQILDEPITGGQNAVSLTGGIVGYVHAPNAVVHGILGGNVFGAQPPAPSPQPGESEG
jgi:hypothetical protein